MPLPKLTDFKSNNNNNYYDAEEESKSFRAKITENINFTRLAKEIETNQSKNFTANNHNLNDNDDDDDGDDEINEENQKQQHSRQQHAQQPKQIFQNINNNRKIIRLNYDFNKDEDETIEPTKKIIFNKASNKYKNKFASNNNEQINNKTIANSKNSINNNNSTELFQLNDNGKLLKIVKIPSFKSSHQQSPLRSSRSTFDDRKGFDDFEIDDENDEVIYSSNNATPVINTSRSSSSKNNSFLNIDNINKYKQKRSTQ